VRLLCFVVSCFSWVRSRSECMVWVCCDWMMLWMSMLGMVMVSVSLMVSLLCGCSAWSIGVCYYCWIVVCFFLVSWYVMWLFLFGFFVALTSLLCSSWFRVV